MLKVIDEKEYKEYAMNSPYISIYQLPEWGKLKEETGWKRHLLGFYKDNLLKGVTMLLEKSTPIKKSLYYSPRGYLLDVNDFKLLKEFNDEVIKYIKEHSGFMLKIDPNVIYAIRDSDGNILDECGKEVYFNFKKLGFKHLGFTKNFETLQPRYLCRFKLKDTYNDTLNSFSKNTKKHIDKTYDMGVRVRKINSLEIEEFTRLLSMSGDVHKFIVRPASYYKKMYDLMSDYINLYITYIDTNLYYEYILNNLSGSKKELDELNKQIVKINVGDKIKRKKKELEERINKLNNKLEEAISLKNSYNKINIGALMSMFIGNEGITMMSGTNNIYKEFSPKYGFYNEHIKECLNRGLEYVNFYGISGDIDKNNPYYGIYEIKKGFNPEIVELIGEFDYIISPFMYYLYKVALKVYKLGKKIRK